MYYTIYPPATIDVSGGPAGLLMALQPAPTQQIPAQSLTRPFNKCRLVLATQSTPE